MSAQASRLNREGDPVNSRVACEGLILGVLIWLPNFAAARLAKVSGEDFLDWRHQALFEAVSTLQAEQKAAGLVEVLEWLDHRNRMEPAGGRAYVIELVDAAIANGAAQFDAYVAAVRAERAGSESAVGQESSVVSPWIGGAELLNDLKELFERYVVLPPHAAEVLALWTAHTYAWQLRRVTTYLGVVSPKKRCGKTTLLTLLDKVVNRPQFASNISPPAIFRAIEEMQPTLLIDEADTFLRGKDELGGILNAGYTRESAYVLRVEGRGRKSPQRHRDTEPRREAESRTEASEGNEGKVHRSQLVKFSCWCPKVIASVGSLPETLADRCVMIQMRRKRAGEKCERLRNFDGSELRERCKSWVEANSGVIEKVTPAIPEGLNDRAADIWEPLLVLADLAGGEWPEVARRAAIELSATGEDQDLTGLLLADIQEIFHVTGVNKVFSRDLVEALAKISDRPWGEVWRGGPINELWLAQQLTPFGIHSRSVRLGVCTGKGYVLEDFEDALTRYLPNGKGG